MKTLNIALITTLKGLALIRRLTLNLPLIATIITTLKSSPVTRFALRRFHRLPKLARRLVVLILILAIVTPFYLFGPWNKDTEAAWFDENWALL